MTYFERQSLKRHFISFSPAYIAILVLSIVLWTWLIPAKLVYKNYEKVGIFYGLDSVEDAKVQTAIMENDSKVLDVESYIYPPSSNRYGSYVQTAGKYRSDFLIMPKSSSDYAMTDLVMEQVCAPLDEGWETFFATSLPQGDISYYSLDGVKYGVLLNPYTSTFLYQEMTMDDEEKDDNGNLLSYYLFINHSSLNFGSYLNKDTSETGIALKALRRLFEVAK